MAERKTIFDAGDTVLYAVMSLYIGANVAFFFAMFEAMLIGSPIGTNHGWTTDNFWSLPSALFWWQASSWTMTGISLPIRHVPWKVVKGSRGAPIAKALLSLFFFTQLIAHRFCCLTMAWASIAHTSWTILRSPYREQIRAAQGALNVLRKEHASEDLIKRAEDEVVLWMSQRRRETEKESNERESERRDAHIAAARKTLNHLDAEAEAEGLLPDANRAPKPTRASNGS